MSGCGPRLVSVKTWHLEWFWYIWPALWYSEANFNENTAPLAHLYNVQAGADTMGYTTGRTVYDIGYVITLLYWLPDSCQVYIY
ncbi:ABC transporter [Penicillium samsonianum]|uniref:ABC transporter n=1 Tax=Penicillium samsonianum TaxID=1882272 RepID=UPI00254916A1|nr:ABC transporter [Penicillium samsonianum]KAJ6150259.1 ABC transporter [Penicillium samsonianum]